MKLPKYHDTMDTIYRLKDALRACILLCLLCFGVNLTSAETWDGRPSAGLSSSGTGKNLKYFITSAGDLKYLIDHKELWNQRFEQTCDIDLCGIPLQGTIGYSTAKGSSNFAFSGTYDGKGFVTKKLCIPIESDKVSWVKDDDTYKANVSFGLFGYVTGTVRNVVIDNANVFFCKSYNYDTGEASYPFVSEHEDLDLKIGVLAGALMATKTIENIIVRNSKITDNGHEAKIHSAFVGGVVGDESSGFGGTTAQNGSTTVLRNIYSNVDFDLSKVTRIPYKRFDNTESITTAKLTQFNVGGIIGRMRKPNVNTYPKNTIYTGTINAPYATVSPVYGIARGNSDNNKRQDYMIQAYSGEYYTNNSDFTFIDEDKLNTLFKDHNWYYSDYNVYDYADGINSAIKVNIKGLDVNNKYIKGTAYGTRTFADNTPINKNNSFDPFNAQSMAQFQGVAHASFVDMNDDSGKSEMLSMLNTYVDNETNLRWIFDGTSPSLIKDKSISLSRTGYDEISVIVSPYDAGEYYIRVDAVDSDNQVTTIDIYPTVIDTVQSLITCKITIPNIDDYAKYVVTLCNSEGEDFTNSDGSNVSASLDLSGYKFEMYKVFREDTDPAEIDEFFYSASLRDKDDNVVVGGGRLGVGQTVTPGYAFLWESSYDPYAATWTNSNLHSWRVGQEDAMHQNWIIPDDPTKYYRVSLCHLLEPVDGVYGYEVIDTKQMGPVNYIFVYDQRKTARGREIGVTTFNGEDKYPDGDDANLGGDPYHAVKTMKRAYELVDPDKGVEGNMIVVMGYFYDDYEIVNQNGSNVVKYDILTYRKSDADKKRFIGPATVTGRFEGSEDIKDGAINIITNNSGDVTGIYAPTKFEYITWTGYAKPEHDNVTGNELLFYANLHDLTFGKGVKMIGYLDVGSTKIGLIKDTKANRITIVSGIHNNNAPLVLPTDNKEPGVTTIDIQSGNFARIISCSRNNKLNSPSLNVFGTPEDPFKVKVIIDIEHTTPKTGNFVPGDYCPPNKYNYDIALLVGGQTDGTVYGDVNIVVKNGYIGRYISGNITFGRGMQSGPSDSFYGRTVLDFEGGDIMELYGGSLGRYDHTPSATEPATHWCLAYFYGTSIINIKGGVIHNNLYGAGAGGILGVGDDRYHTDDMFIPYYMGTGDAKTLKYGTYNTIKEYANNLNDGSTVKDVIAQVRANNGLVDGVIDYENISLVKARTELNVYSGVIHGDVFGGGYGYANEIGIDKAPALAGNLYGNTSVLISKLPGLKEPVIDGNVYGGGEGSDDYYKLAKKNSEIDENKFTALACVFGDTNVKIEAGTIGGMVFGGSKGIEDFPDMAALYGDTHVEITGGSIDGHIFGGADVAAIRDITRKETDDTSLSNVPTGNTSVIVSGGSIGDCIFAASRGSLGDKATEAVVHGNTNLLVTGGGFKPTPYINNVDNTDGYRSFNIYGGGYLNCIVEGRATVKATASLLASMDSFMPFGENPNEWPDAITEFQAAYWDISYRRFSVYGGGEGEKTHVLNTNVTIDLPTTLKKPHGYTLKDPYYGQSFFDVSGGGFAGDIGYWANKDGVAVHMLENPTAEDYDHYVGGNCEVHIDGYTYTRKVIGGGFYGSCYNTNTVVTCGSLRQVYGGSLLGNVFGHANLIFGNRTQDFIPGYNGNRASVSDADWQAAEAKAKALNDYLYVTEYIYGANDVEGIVGASLWKDALGNYVYDRDGSPFFTAEVSDPTKGVDINIFGGTFMADVYCAGNGHYRGYFVPEWSRYDDGPDRLYNHLISSLDPTKTAKAYRSRPMVGRVRLNIQGNTEDDFVNISGDFYGGGRDCTIGQWNPILPSEDPRRLVKGGSLALNFGSHVHVSGNMYMGADGRMSLQQKLPIRFDPKHFDGSTTTALESIEDAAYYHWYYDMVDQCYKPGFPAPGKVDGNYHLPGDHLLRSYMKNIEYNGALEITFYDKLYERNDDGTYKRDDNGNLIRKRWLPLELAYKAYDSHDITLTNFFLGGRSGSLTNNTWMFYDYDGHYYGGDDGIAGNTPEDKKIELFGATYRLTLPLGVVVNNSVVMGSQDAVTRIYPYSADYTSIVKKTAEGDDIEPWYTYEGGVITQRLMSYDIIVYNDMQRRADPTWKYTLSLPADFYDVDKNADVRNSFEYTLADGTTIIYRYGYIVEDGSDVPYLTKMTDDNSTKDSPYLYDRRYGIAVIEAADGLYSYIGPHEDRLHENAVKLGAACTFTLHDVKASGAAGGGASGDQELEDHHHKAGGLIYGGCYNTGYTFGNVVLNVSSEMECEHINPDVDESYGELSSLRHNIGRVYGGGYGVDTHIYGDTHVNLLFGFRGLNVFGGGHGGEVTGTTNVTYVGDVNSYVFGSIFGGGMLGEVGTGYRVFDDDGNLTDCISSRYDDNKLLVTSKANATNVSLISGNVKRVYGGSCMADVYGSTNIDIHEKILNSVDLKYINFEKILSSGIIPDDLKDMAKAHLVVGSVYGGNDVCGDIHTFGDEIFSTNISVAEDEGNEVQDKPGSDGKYRGYPLIGSLYAGGNGNYADDINGRYADGATVKLFIGTEDERHVTDEDGVLTYEIGGLKLPDVESSNVNIHGGTIVNVFGGANNATVTKRSVVTVDYKNPVVRFGYSNPDYKDVTKSLSKIIYNIFELESKGQFLEVLDETFTSGALFKYQIYNLYSGNNQADMDIQPKIYLKKGHLGNVYGGGNLGRMTYCDMQGEGESATHTGISMTVDSPDIHISSIYGGGRVGDIRALDADGEPVTFKADEYGAKLNIYDGVIEAVYGGNDVSGTVYNGSNVNIFGAIAGDVYGAGNGNYLYKYDTALKIGDDILEMFDDENYGGRYFCMPPKAEYGGKDATDAQKILAINSYRPNSDKVFLNIRGSESTETVDDTEVNKTNIVWVKGSVYCGGNSSTVHLDHSTNLSHIKLNIGDHVRLNGVFLGSNGASLVDTSEDGYIDRFETLNDIKLSDLNDLTDADVVNAYDKKAVSTEDYPDLLALFMRSVEVDGMPDEFKFDITKDDSYVGNFCIGGNRGSMMTDRTIELTLPESLYIYGNVVGGCYNTNFTYHGIPYVGGMKRKLADDNVYGDDKLRLSIKSRFVPQKLVIDDDGVNMVDDLSGDMYQSSLCNIYGGCFDSGTTVGNIHIDLYSDMLDYDNDVINKQAIINGINDPDNTDRQFVIVGGGYGSDTKVLGDINVSMLPELVDDGTDGGQRRVSHPSAAIVFGGSRLGEVIGNTLVEIRDGKILANVYGASEAARLYGSTSVLLGYPVYYTAKQKGIYKINRTDRMSKTAAKGYKTEDGAYAVPKTITYHVGDIVPGNIAEKIRGRINTSISGFQIGQNVADDALDLITTGNFTDYFAEQTATPATFGVTWDDINIWVGDQRSNPDSEFYDDGIPSYGHGNIYGGGYIANSASESLVGKNTVLKYDSNHTPLGGVVDDFIGFGGNSAVLIWDNKENADLTKTVRTASASDGSLIKDHIHIGNGTYKPVAKKVGLDKMGLYTRTVSHGKVTFVHQPPGDMTADDVANNNYYTKVADGGIYGGGRKVFVEGFRVVDLAYYGYAGHCPETPKLLNTLQRADMVRVTDCCMELIGASDFTTDVIDNTLYSINRVGELSMVSSLSPTDNLIPATVDAGFHNNLVHLEPRSRNYIGFYHTVHYLSAFSSNWTLEDKYHDKEGQAIAADTDAGHIGYDGYPYIDEVGNKYESYVDHKHKIIDKYNVYRYKKKNGYYETTPSMSEDEMNALSAEESAEINSFNMRNVATSGNMIGISNGFALRFDGLSCKEGESQESLYYGPAYGVTEIKLLTLAVGEGGGYVYALNHHYDDAVDNSDPDAQTADWCSKFGQDFLMTTGNFVFPGAGYNEDVEYNYIVDDCVPRLHGYYEYKQDYENAHPAASRADGFNVNDVQEVHYWYVNGQIYYYNLKVTGITSDNPHNFFLNNDNDMIDLTGVQPGSSIKVTKVVWNDHETDYDCDINNLEKDYKLFFSVDHETKKYINQSANGAYIAPIPRSDYLMADDGTVTFPATHDSVDPNPDGNETAFTDYTLEGGGSATNVPRLGIRLYDNQKNRLADRPVEVGRKYYEDHLKDPHQVQVVLKAKHPNSEQTFTYVINLTIDYVLGPLINGQVEIENCALPGEYIYANADQVTVDMDENNLGITGQFWKLYPNDEHGQRITDLDGKEVSIDLDDHELYAEYFIGNNERKIRIPAHFYQDGWEVVYVIQVGSEFEFETLSPAIDDPDVEHPRLTVHNYHRMKAMKGNEEIYQILTPGSRIYIEDAADMARFLQFADSLSQAGHTPRALEGTNLVDRPVNCEGLKFYLMNDLTIPYGHIVPAAFGGQLSGNGYTLTDDASSALIRTLAAGSVIRDLGFIGNGDGSQIVDTNNGQLINCFYYSDNDKGRFYKNGTGTSVNCYHNLSSSSVGTYASNDDFRYGRVAYNLNSYYLDGRYYKLKGLDPHCDYLNDYYRNGDYRYALVSTDRADALRTFDRPNYKDYDGTHRSFHNTLHTVDTPRHVDAVIDDEGNVTTEAHYQPLFPSDYFMFGQSLAVTDVDVMPKHYTEPTRVYRASGFYRSMVDRGFHFNKSAVALQPTLTAVDFTGYRDRGKTPVEGWKVDDKTDIYYAPVLDMPDELTSFDSYTHINRINNSTDGDDHVTRNLLVYTPQDDSAYSAFDYTETKSESDIYGHRIFAKDATGDNIAPVIPFMHLVDLEDFNCPIEFTAQRALYGRTPTNYSTGNNAWEGLCLPFTVQHVKGHALDNPLGDVEDRGELSHFYGDGSNGFVNADGEEYSHEYWLRKYTGAGNAGLYFDRPGSSDDSSNPVDEPCDYHYSNTYFSLVYGDYDQGTDHIRKQYTTEGVTYNGYRMITGEMPYIISFPGKRYYEFDLSGEFYAEIFKSADVVKQTIDYTSDNAVIKVTDNNNIKRMTHDGYTFTGTYLHYSDDRAYTAAIDDVVTDCFMRSGQTVMPFRAYVRMSDPQSAPLPILSRSIESLDVQQPDDADDAVSAIRVYVDGADLMVDYPYDEPTTMPVHDIEGRLVRYIDVMTGTNRYSGIAPGYYIVNSTTILLR